MEEQEPPIEHVQKEIEHHAEHVREGWISGVALSAALLAALAAVASLLSGHHANEAMLEQIRASDQWAYYQAKSIKGLVLASKLDMLSGMGKPTSEKDRDKLAEYQKDQDEIQRDAKEKESASREHLARHLVLARSVTLFQIAIAVAAIAVLVRRRAFWYVGLCFGAAGLFFLAWAALLR